MAPAANELASVSVGRFQLLSAARKRRRSCNETTAELLRRRVEAEAQDEAKPRRRAARLTARPCKVDRLASLACPVSRALREQTFLRVLERKVLGAEYSGCARARARFKMSTSPGRQRISRASDGEREKKLLLVKKRISAMPRASKGSLASCGRVCSPAQSGKEWR